MKALRHQRDESFHREEVDKEGLRPRYGQAEVKRLRTRRDERSRMQRGRGGRVRNPMVVREGGREQEG